jgi:predicted GNAT family acetyltransferase
VLDAARGDGLAVLPHCPFIAGYIREHADDYLELVPEERRSKFNL